MWLANNQWVCAEHWRRYVPPRSRARRAYHAYFRRAKRHGWTPELVDRFYRFWDQLARLIDFRAREGWIDEHEIARLMGWDDRG